VFYQAFEPAEAGRLGERFEVHYTPKHARWMNTAVCASLHMMYAECELSVLGRPCLDHRIADRQTLEREVAHWEHTRNSQKIRVDWQFTTADARIKLKRLYPVLEPMANEVG
jgi:hypothetical protein